MIWINYKLMIISCGPGAVTSLEQITCKKIINLKKKKLFNAKASEESQEYN